MQYPGILFTFSDNSIAPPTTIISSVTNLSSRSVADSQTCKVPILLALPHPYINEE